MNRSWTVAKQRNYLSLLKRAVEEVAEAVVAVSVEVDEVSAAAEETEDAKGEEVWFRLLEPEVRQLLHPTTVVTIQAAIGKLLPFGLVY
ncbi:unnamed protein product [Eruca vesicaria subsp. sativa]|uniref:Uncharacterized protein n=1 Tax=Eruca vesicaria subsp. sativa TaxID=29727 RepID=A0ABC8IZP4_ERUVS|nr:unnamed protein product [Eruca vesicaria subsp. sativa]